MKLLEKSPAGFIFVETNLPFYSPLANWYYTKIDKRKQIWNGSERIINPVTLLGAGLSKDGLLCD